MPVLRPVGRAMTRGRRDTRWSIARTAIEGYCLESCRPVLFLLRSPVPIESDTVVAGLALSLAVDAAGFLFAAEAMSVSVLARRSQEVQHTTLLCDSCTAWSMRCQCCICHDRSVGQADSPAPVARPLLHLFAILLRLLWARHLLQYSSTPDRGSRDSDHVKPEPERSCAFRVLIGDVDAA
jgi:hypothetical protein